MDTTIEKTADPVAEPRLVRMEATADVLEFERLVVDALVLENTEASLDDEDFEYERV